MNTIKYDRNTIIVSFVSVISLTTLEAVLLNVRGTTDFVRDVGHFA